MDLGSMDLEELIALRSEITKEIESRISSDSEVINPGFYIVGKDIIAESYVLTAGEDYVNVGVLRDQKALEEQDESAVIAEVFLDAGEAGTVNLVNGNVLMVQNSSSFIRINQASWRPSEPALETAESETE